MYAFGGCPTLNDFDVLAPVAPSETEFLYPLSTGSAVVSQDTLNSVGSVARVVLSGFSYSFIRDFSRGEPMARVEHLKDIITWFDNGLGAPVGAGTQASFNQFLANNYPNPFNPTTNIRYGIRSRGPVTLRVYDVEGKLVRTL